MAGDWFPIRTDLWDDPRVVRMASLLNVNRAAVVGACQRTWSLGNVYTTDGRIAGYTGENLDAAVTLPGWSEAMAAVGWLVLEAEAVIIPDFEKFNGQGAKRRAQDRDRKQNVRNVSAFEADKKRTRGEAENRTEQEENRTASDLDRAKRFEGEEEGEKKGYSIDLSSVEPPNDTGAVVLELLRRSVKAIPLGQSNDWPLLVKTAILVSEGELSENDFQEALDAAKGAKGKRVALYFRCLENKALDAGQEFKRMLAGIRIIPAWLPRPVKRR